MQDFRRLKVWGKAHEVALETYRATEAFPADERFELRSQMRRAAVSIPCNIAEGCGRQTDRELVGYLQIAMGSASELEYQILLARDLGLAPPAVFAPLAERVDELKRMLSRLIVAVRRRSRPATARAGRTRSSDPPRP